MIKTIMTSLRIHGDILACIARSIYGNKVQAVIGILSAHSPNEEYIDDVELWSKSHLALAIVAQSQTLPLDASWGLTEMGHGTRGELFNFDGLVGDFIGDNEMLMDNEASRRHLAGNKKLSYGMLKGNNVPCNQRGSSYYNCQKGGKANPYRRGCNQITRCARNTN
ncbi:Rapid ALkalinization Factor [Dillenia turbinata]|uniref:Rapid ALkalinization Factor n=1 Tax=Dillenia turbinata TaxID=194707 RepID=A0AAN8Z1T6_9MAGN